MPITYTLIGFDRRPLAEAGERNHVAHNIMARYPAGEHLRKSFSHENQTFHLDASADGLVFLCLATSSMTLNTCFSYLQDIRGRFYAQYEGVYQNAADFSLNDFSRVAIDRMNYFSQDQGADTLSRAKSEVDKVKEQMLTNIDKVIDRGGNIESLRDQTDDLEEQTYVFKKAANDVHRSMWWKNTRMMVLLVITVVVVLAILIGLLVLIFK
eukprot:TRINITY_DN4429_c0_g1_i1.p1 TRINITY_DN4429_c0_g1~~TRINITY_DN4429_c0_g1_i1.p1  ORF type:complete len:211 (-),score=76.92 TRINITY_DN4429_c0_g1_i1:130-762(-)